MIILHSECSSKCKPEEEKLNPNWFIYEGPTTPELEPNTIILHLQKDDCQDVQAEIVFKNLIQPIERFNQDKTPLADPIKDDLISIKDYINNKGDAVLTNWDFKNIFDIRAGSGEILPSGRAAYIRNFNIPAYLTPYIKVFLNTLGSNLEKRNDALGSKPIIIRGVNIKAEELYFNRKIIGVTHEAIEVALLKYQAAKRKLDRLLLRSLPNGNMLK